MKTTPRLALLSAGNEIALLAVQQLAHRIPMTEHTIKEVELRKAPGNSETRVSIQSRKQLHTTVLDHIARMAPIYLPTIRLATEYHVRHKLLST